MIDFEKEFSDFTATGGDSGSSIKEIYSLIPSLTQQQLEIIMQLEFFISKYNLEDLSYLVVKYLSIQKKNKNLSFIKNNTLKNLMRAYTQEEFIRGVKVNRQVVEEQ